MADGLGRFAADPSLVNTMGAAGRMFAESYTWDRAAEETEAHLLKVLDLHVLNTGG
jgi:glycosyltransferase involved in cell wall biosynthesis